MAKSYCQPARYCAGVKPLTIRELKKRTSRKLRRKAREATKQGEEFHHLQNSTRGYGCSSKERGYGPGDGKSLVFENFVCNGIVFTDVKKLSRK